MEYLVSGAQMKQYDADTVKRLGIPSLVLMERAADAAAWEIQSRFEKKQGKRSTRVLVIAGCGNNGGDGFAVGRILQEYGYETEYVLIGTREKCSAETKAQIQILERSGCRIRQTLSGQMEALPYDIIVDALFGIGLSRELTGIFEEAVAYMNKAESYVVSLDIPSGIHADTGAVMGSAVRADLTVTFGYRKLGLVFYPGAEYAGEVVCRKVGISWHDGLCLPEAFTYHMEDLSKLPARKKDGNKGSFGKVLVIAGGKNIYGACEFAALGAYRSGAGLVRILTAEENRGLLMQKVPEALVDTYSEETKEEELIGKLEAAFAWADCVIIGPGIGQEKAAFFMMEYVWKNCTLPLIVDADGLNILAGCEEWLCESAKRKSPFICLTPHMGELSRLTKKSIKCCKDEILSLTKEYAKKYQVILAAKDARTIVAMPDGKVYINTTGDNGMATGGSGDVLTGIMAGLIAQKMEKEEAVCMAVCLHGLAGNAATKRQTAYCVMAGDLLLELPKLFAKGEELQ